MEERKRELRNLVVRNLKPEGREPAVDQQNPLEDLPVDQVVEEEVDRSIELE
jgi:hypothetical protein